MPKSSTGEVVSFKGWPKLHWFITDHLPKPPKDWQIPPKMSDDSPAYIEVGAVSWISHECDCDFVFDFIKSWWAVRSQKISFTLIRFKKQHREKPNNDLRWNVNYWNWGKSSYWVHCFSLNLKAFCLPSFLDTSWYSFLYKGGVSSIISSRVLCDI